MTTQMSNANKINFVSIFVTLIVLAMMLLAAPASAQGEVCGYKVYTLDGNNNPGLGTVNVWNDFDNMYVQFQSNGMWFLNSTKAHVALDLGGIPADPNGYAHAGTPGFLSQSFTFTIPLTNGASATVIIAARADVSEEEFGTLFQTDIAWGGSIVGSNPPRYIQHTGEECTPPPALEGCTPGYWRQAHHYDSWVNYVPGNDYASVFGAGPSMSLEQAVWLGGGQLDALMRHSVAALLNTTNGDVNYTYSTSDVIAMTQAAINSGNYEATKNQFEYANELGCDLN